MCALCLCELRAQLSVVLVAIFVFVCIGGPNCVSYCCVWCVFVRVVGPTACNAGVCALSLCELRSHMCVVLVCAFCMCEH